MPDYCSTPPQSIANDPVRIWRASVGIPTYPTPAPDKNPMFFNKRVYQGSSGRLYPLPFIDKVSDEPVERSYDGVWLENEYVRLLMLPEFGGRIHLGQDKTRGDYDFFYRQDVIKPALVALAGPWISGGVEFNWPQHHRPSTHLPADYTIEEHPDGSRTCWMSEHDPMARMKGMVGIRLRPNSSLIEADVRLYNRTPFMQTFLWWANVAARVHDRYQSFFPTDVHYVADHAVRAMTEFPIARGKYYGVDYSPGTDLSWYKNIPVPTSYMVLGSNFDFFGGYDHEVGAGFVHVANRHIAPGKKQWTWGNHEFGWAWDRELTNQNGPYVELMAGVYTNNQPDFSYLAPYETKTFSQYWWPIQGIGCAKNANRDVAINLEVKSGVALIGAAASRRFEAALIRLVEHDRVHCELKADIAPGCPLVQSVGLPSGVHLEALQLTVLDATGNELISYSLLLPPEQVEVPPPAREPPPPEAIDHADELFLTGEHLEQYRHPTRKATDYWQEALRRDPSDSRCNLALGRQRLRRGLFKEAENYLRRSIAKLTFRHPNPVDGEAHYHLGLALRYQGKTDEAYASFYKSTWNYAWRSPAYYALATIDASCGRHSDALEHATLAAQHNQLNSKAHCLKSAILRRMNRIEEARGCVESVIARDLLDYYALNELALIKAAMGDSVGSELAAQELLKRSRGDFRTLLDIAFDYAEAGFFADALGLLERLPEEARTHYLAPYALGWLHSKIGNKTESERFLRLAARGSADYGFPSQIDELLLLKWVITVQEDDAYAHYCLGNLYYDQERFEDAMHCWQRSVDLRPSFSIPHRNLGIAYFNVLQDGDKAIACYEAAFEANPKDSRLLFELDQLHKKLRHSWRDRLEELSRHENLVFDRDDLTIEYCALLNLSGDYQKSAQIISQRRFHPWEGGEGKVLQQYVQTELALGEQALDQNNPVTALAHFERALVPPLNLGETRHLLSSTADIYYWLGKAHLALANASEAKRCFEKADQSDASNENEPSETSYWRALALRQLGASEKADAALRALLDYGRKKLHTEPKIDYFATSLPQLLVFEDNLDDRNECDSSYLIGLAYLGLGNADEARRSLERTLDLEPSHYGAARAIRRILVNEAI